MPPPPNSTLKTFPHFIGLKRQAAIDPCPEPDESIPRPLRFFMIYFSIILPFKLRSSNSPPSVRIPNQNPVWISSLAYTCIHMPHSFHLRDFITLKIGGKKYKSRKRSLWNFLLVLLLPSSYVQIFSSAPCCNTRIHTHTPSSYCSRRIAYYNTFNLY